ncbi:MAG: hypothetical protein ACOCQR_03310 [bacterium]
MINNPFGFEAILKNAIKADRQEKLKTSPQLTLSELILKLETMDEGLPVYFDNKKYRPTSIGSWRGSYDELSINYEGSDEVNSDKVEEEIDMREYGKKCIYVPFYTTLPKDVRVKDLLQMLKSIIGKTMTGYKGGDFLIGKSTPLWVSKYGESGGYRTNKEYDKQAIIDVEKKEESVRLKTKLIPY